MERGRSTGSADGSLSADIDSKYLKILEFTKPFLDRFSVTIGSLVAICYYYFKHLSLFQACATFCLLTEACLSFDFNSTLPDCNWFTVADVAYVTDRMGYEYYPKNIKLVRLLRA